MENLAVFDMTQPDIVEFFLNLVELLKSCDFRQGFLFHLLNFRIIFMKNLMISLLLQTFFETFVLSYSVSILI